MGSEMCIRDRAYAVALLPSYLTTRAITAGPWAPFLTKSNLRNSALNKLWSINESFQDISPIQWNVAWPPQFNHWNEGSIEWGISEIEHSNPSLANHLSAVWRIIKAQVPAQPRELLRFDLFFQHVDYLRMTPTAEDGERTRPRPACTFINGETRRGPVGNLRNPSMLQDGFQFFK